MLGKNVLNVQLLRIDIKSMVKLRTILPAHKNKFPVRKNRFIKSQQNNVKIAFGKRCSNVILLRSVNAVLTLFADFEHVFNHSTKL